MTNLTTDPNHPDLKRGMSDAPTEPQNKVYLVASPEELAKGFVRPVRQTYRHHCGTHTTMGLTLAQTYARDPDFYGYTYCCGCMKHLPVSEFDWVENNGSIGPKVGS